MALLVVGAIFSVAIIGLLAMGVLGSLSSGFSAANKGHYQEEWEEEGAGLSKIVIIDVAGVISSADTLSYPASSQEIIRQLRQASEDEAVAAVVLDMNTPGGEVIATDEIHHEIQRLREEHQLPVVTCMRTVAASGGYYIAAGTDWIVANRMTFTGSIGVIMGGFDMTRLLEGWKIEPIIYKSGSKKDIMSMTRPPTPEEKLILQALIEQTFHEFALIVATGRNLSLDAVKDPAGSIGDGRLLSGAQALELGLVDELGYMENAIAKARELAKDPGAGVVRYHDQPSLMNLLRMQGEAGGSITVELPGLEGPRLQRGIAYYLSESAL